MRPYQTSKFRTRPARALLLAAAPALALVAMLPALGPVLAGPPVPLHPCGLQVGSGSLVTINQNATYNCMDVAGTLRIAAGVTLTLDGDPCSTSTVDGAVILEGAGSQLAFIDNNHTVQGSGWIDGQHDAAKITIAGGETLTNQVTIRGNMTIEGDGNFTNQGKVLANNAGTLEIKVGGTIADSANTGSVSSSNYRWAVDTSGAKLLFSESATGLLGHFYECAGTLEVNKASASIDACTTGDLLMTGGKIVAGINDSFSAGGSCP